MLSNHCGKAPSEEGFEMASIVLANDLVRVWIIFFHVQQKTTHWNRKTLVVRDGVEHVGDVHHVIGHEIQERDAGACK